MANGIGPIANLLGKVDANGALLVAIDADGPSTATRFFADASATLPGFSITGDTNTGWGASAADTVAVWAGGTTPILTGTSTAVTVASGVTLGWSDAAFSRSSANVVSLGASLLFGGAYNIGDGAGNSPVNIYAEGGIFLANSQALQGRNNANNANYSLVAVNTSDQMQLSPSGRDIIWYGNLLAGGAYNIGDGAGNSPVNIYAETAVAIGTTPATSGLSLRIPHGGGIAARNSGNASNLIVLDFGATATDVVTIGENNVAGIALNPGSGDIKWGKALVALGGGAAPTLGTIGGSGPATAAQNTWLRMVDSTGAAFWVPAWK